jgi:hypothetical protein
MIYVGHYGQVLTITAATTLKYLAESTCRRIRAGIHRSWLSSQQVGEDGGLAGGDPTVSVAEGNNHNECTRSSAIV